MSAMKQYVIYENPSDFPGKFVVRVWHIQDGKFFPEPEVTAVVDSIHAARIYVPVGYYPLDRFTEDDPAIREVWI